MVRDFSIGNLAWTKTSYFYSYGVMIMLNDWIKNSNPNVYGIQVIRWFSQTCHLMCHHLILEVDSRFTYTLDYMFCSNFELNCIFSTIALVNTNKPKLCPPQGEAGLNPVSLLKDTHNMLILSMSLGIPCLSEAFRWLYDNYPDALLYAFSICCNFCSFTLVFIINWNCVLNCFYVLY